MIFTFEMSDQIFEDGHGRLACEVCKFLCAGRGTSSDLNVPKIIPRRLSLTSVPAIGKYESTHFLTIFVQTRKGIPVAHGTAKSYHPP
jgi:hypothetical protein